MSLAAKRPCWVGVYWGTTVSDMYPVIHRPWLEIRDIASSSASMSDISLHHEDLHMLPFYLLCSNFNLSARRGPGVLASEG